MNFCTHCGKQLKPNVKFCSKCGQVIMEKPSLPLDKPIVPHCRKCGSQLTAEVRFCVQCGTPVSSEDPTAAPLQPTSSAKDFNNDTNAVDSPGIQKTVKKSRHRFIKITSAIILLSGGGLAALWFLRSL